MTQRAKTKHPSKTQVAKILRDCSCDPRKAPYEIIAETGTPDYLIRNALVILQRDVLPFEREGRNAMSVDKNLRQAITLLGLAAAKRDLEAGTLK